MAYPKALRFLCRKTFLIGKREESFDTLCDFFKASRHCAYCASIFEGERKSVSFRFILLLFYFPFFEQTKRRRKTHLEKTNDFKER